MVRVGLIGFGLAGASFHAPLIAGVVASAISGWLAIAVLLKYVARHSYGLFALYRLVVGGGVLLLAALRG